MNYDDFDYEKHPYGYHPKDKWCSLLHSIIAIIICVGIFIGFLFLSLSNKITILAGLAFTLYVLKQE